ncbi:hypothetical protein GGF31_005123 [Allomyces arbusculus]|nr:hypothetical protein GGF31_005123 [Allomyces arbusculus]
MGTPGGECRLGPEIMILVDELTLRVVLLTAFACTRERGNAATVDNWSVDVTGPHVQERVAALIGHIDSAANVRVMGYLPSMRGPTVPGHPETSEQRRHQPLPLAALAAKILTHTLTSPGKSAAYGLTDSHERAKLADAIVEMVGATAQGTALPEVRLGFKGQAPNRPAATQAITIPNPLVNTANGRVAINVEGAMSFRRDNAIGHRLRSGSDDDDDDDDDEDEESDAELSDISDSHATDVDEQRGDHVPPDVPRASRAAESPKAWCGHNVGLGLGDGGGEEEICVCRHVV